MHRHGYAYTRTTGVNDWFERHVTQSGTEMARVALPHYGESVPALVKAALARAGLLSFVEHVHDLLPGQRPD